MPHDTHDRFAPPGAIVSDATRPDAKFQPVSLGVLALLSACWLWLLSLSPMVFELTKTGATNVVFMLGVYGGLVLVLAGGILFLRRSRKSVYVLGAAGLLLLLAALHLPLWALVATAVLSVCAAVAAGRNFRKRPVSFLGA